MYTQTGPALYRFWLIDFFFVVKPLIVGEQKHFPSTNVQRSTDTGSGNKQDENKELLNVRCHLGGHMTFKLQLKCDLFWKLEYVASCFRCFLSGAMKNVISVYAVPPHGRWCFHDRFDWRFLFNPLQASLTADEETRTPWSPWTATHLTGLSVLTPPRPTELLHVALRYRHTHRLQVMSAFDLATLNKKMDLRLWNIHMCRHQGGRCLPALWLYVSSSVYRVQEVD